MRFDFSQLSEDAGEGMNFCSVSAGEYACRVAEVREGRARDGSVRWSIRLEVAEGEYAGRTAAWDSLVWSEAGVRRVRHVFAALGLDVGGELELDAHDLVDLRARVTVEPEEREDANTGRRMIRMRVPWNGYDRVLAPVDGGPAAAADCECRECAHRFVVAHVARCPKCDSRYLQTLAFQGAAATATKG